MNPAKPAPVFLKLGGSLITDKDRPLTVRQEVLDRLAAEIFAARTAKPDQPLLLGHGSGSFGHTTAARYGTRQGVRDAAGWRGFADVWYAARTLNQIVVDSLVAAGLPVIAFPPSACYLADNGVPKLALIEPIRRALQVGLIPLVAGDVVFDEGRGGTILSTEDIFGNLAGPLQPSRILLAGREAGVFRDFPNRGSLVGSINQDTLPDLISTLGASASIDVTGGMIQKVTQMIALAQRTPGMEVWIFSGQETGAVQQALAGHPNGTRITA